MVENWLRGAGGETNRVRLLAAPPASRGLADGAHAGCAGRGRGREGFVLVRTGTEHGFKPHICSPMYYGAAYFCVPVAAITKIMEGVCYNRKMEFSPCKCCLKYCFSSELFIERIWALLFFFIHARDIERVGFLILQLCRERGCVKPCM